jgi:hypothetical protein
MANAADSKTKRTAPKSTARPTHARSARAREEAARRQRILWAVGASALVVVLIVVLVVVKASSGGKSSGPPAAASANPAVPASLLASLAAIPPSQLAQAERLVGANVGAPSPISDTPLTSAGRPEVFYLGAEFCPYCAAERWAMVVALGHFGSFSGLTETHSSSIDVDPDTPTFAFHGTTYSSPYLSFVGVETTTNQPQGNFYAPLDNPTPAQTALLVKYNGGNIPFVDFGGKAVIKSPQYDPKILAGLTVDQVAAQVPNLNTAIGQAVEASAARDISTICQMTGGQPSNVCSAFAGSSAS